jgi:hypothetical protein
VSKWGWRGLEGLFEFEPLRMCEASSISFMKVDTPTSISRLLEQYSYSFLRAHKCLCIQMK